MKYLTCQNILNLIPLYIEGKTSEEQNAEINHHLQNCEDCQTKYLYLKDISERIKNAFDNIDEKQFNYDYKFFSENLSAYIDNELSNEDYFRFNLYVTTHPEAKKELEESLYFKEQLQNIFENQNLLGEDLSNNILKIIKSEDPDYFSNFFVKMAFITVLFIVLTIFITYLTMIKDFSQFSDIKNSVYASIHNHSLKK